MLLTPPEGFWYYELMVNVCKQHEPLENTITPTVTGKVLARCKWCKVAYYCDYIPPKVQVEKVDT